jgi:hypothetical protein
VEPSDVREVCFNKVVAQPALGVVPVFANLHFAQSHLGEEANERRSLRSVFEARFDERGRVAVATGAAGPAP